MPHPTQLLTRLTQCSYAGFMKKPPRRRKNAIRFPTSAKDRWLPTENTRAQTFADRRKAASKNACRGRVSLDA